MFHHRCGINPSFNAVTNCDWQHTLQSWANFGEDINVSLLIVKSITQHLNMLYNACCRGALSRLMLTLLTPELNRFQAFCCQRGPAGDIAQCRPVRRVWGTSQTGQWGLGRTDCVEMNGLSITAVNELKKVDLSCNSRAKLQLHFWPQSWMTRS